MSNLPDGTYRLYNAGTGYLLDVAGNGFAQGTNVQIYSNVSAQNDAQIFEVTTRSTGTRRIMNRISGKNLDVDNAVAAVGQNVQIWREYYATWEGQALTIEATGNTKTIGGTVYDTYYIAMESAPTYTFDIAGTSSGSNVILRTKSNPRISKSNEWVFVPVPSFESGGIYEIRPYLDPKNLALDIRGANIANGANLQIYGVNHTNAQKFYITNENDGYSIRCLHSGKYIDVSAAVAADGINVQAWEDNDTRAQRWNMMTYNTMTIDGKTCLVVRFGSYVTDDGTTYMMDVSAAQTAWQTNVQIYSYNNTDAQLFVLYPSEGADPTMAVPFDFGIADSIEGARLPYSESPTFKLAWRCAKSWAGDGTNHYQLRYRNRYMSPLTSSWKDWNDWTAWEEAAANTEGSAAFMPDPFEDDYTWATAKNSEWEFQLRAAAADEDYKVLHGTHIDSIFNVYRKPTVALTSAGWSPDGLHIAMTSDYTLGTTYANVRRITSGNTKLFEGVAVLEATGATGSDTVSNEDMLVFPEDGSTITVTFTPGYDQHQAFATEQTAMLTVSYDGGTVDVTPTFIRNGYKLTALVPTLGTERVWVPFANALYECEQDADYNAPAGFTAFNVLYPMGAEYQVFTEAHNSDRSQWGTDMSERSAINYKAHAFDWDGRSLYIDQFGEGGESYGASGNATYQADVLDNREHESVSFAKTVKKQFEVSGILTGYTVEDVEAMVGKHVKYRSPDGGIFDAAVVSYSATIRNGYTEVSISMIEETR